MADCNLQPDPNNSFMVDPVNLPKNIRAFVAIFPDVAVAKKLALLQTDLKK